MVNARRSDRTPRGLRIAVAVSYAALVIAVGSAAVLSLTTSPTPAVVAVPDDSATPPGAVDSFLARLSAPLPPRPTEVDCTFRGDAEVVCVRQWETGPATTTVLPWPVTQDQRSDLIREGVNWPPRPESGREQYLTPLEVTAAGYNKPLAPRRHCPDGTFWYPWVLDCPDLSQGYVSWVHHDGTEVIINPDASVWPNPSPEPRRCPGSDHWVPYVPECPR